MQVTRCVCRNVSLTVIVSVAEDLRAHGTPVTLDGLISRTRAGTCCGSCRPYLARAAISGETSQPVMNWHEGERWIERLERECFAQRPDSAASSS